jgi:Tfp pilus assembly protein PilP
MPAHADTLAAVSACRALSSDAERLACYDAAVDRAAGMRAPAVATPAQSPTTTVTTPAVTAPAVAAAVGTAATIEPETDFGLSEQARREREGVAALPSITARVTGVVQRGDGRQALTLDNQQTWVQVDATTRVRLRTGDEVTIRRAALSSFLLSKAGSGSMRVRRER